MIARRYSYPTCQEKWVVVVYFWKTWAKISSDNGIVSFGFKSERLSNRIRRYADGLR